MIRNCIVRDFLGFLKTYYFGETDHDKTVAYLDLRKRMCNDAIHDNGIFETFKFSKDNNDLILSYIKIEDKDIELYPDMFVKRTGVKQISLHCPIDPDPGYKDILGSCLIYHETGEINDKLKPEFEAIKERCVKNFDAVYSTVKIDNIDIDEIHEIISIHYSYYYIKDEFIDKINSDDVIFGKAPLPYGEWFNLGSHSTDVSGKVNIALTKDVEAALNEGYIDCSAPDSPKINTYYSENALNEAKENSNMKIHLLIVPKGMSEEFVNNTKKNLQTNNHTMLYLSSNDIAFKPHDKYRTKYDLFEYWITFGMIYCVEFMMGYENDPEAKAFESFIRGIRAISTLNIVNLQYQKDTIVYQEDDVEKIIPSIPITNVGVNIIPYNEDISDVGIEYPSVVTTNVPDGEFVKYDAKSEQLVKSEDKSSDQ